MNGLCVLHHNVEQSIWDSNSSIDRNHRRYRGYIGKVDGELLIELILKSVYVFAPFDDELGYDAVAKLCSRKDGSNTSRIGYYEEPGLTP